MGTIYVLYGEREKKSEAYEITLALDGDQYARINLLIV